MKAHLEAALVTAGAGLEGVLLSTYQDCFRDPAKFAEYYLLFAIFMLGWIMISAGVLSFTFRSKAKIAEAVPRELPPRALQVELTVLLVRPLEEASRPTRRTSKVSLFPRRLGARFPSSSPSKVIFEMLQDLEAELLTFDNRIIIPTIIDPRMCQRHCDRAAELMVAGRYSEARIETAKAISCDPTSSWAWKLRSRAVEPLEPLGIHYARECMAKAVLINPRDTDARLRLEFLDYRIKHPLVQSLRLPLMVWYVLRQIYWFIIEPERERR